MLSKRILTLLIASSLSITGCSNKKEDTSNTVKTITNEGEVYDRTIPVIVKKVYKNKFTALHNDEAISVYSSIDKLKEIHEGDSVNIKKYLIINLKDKSIKDVKYKY